MLDSKNDLFLVADVTEPILLRRPNTMFEKKISRAFVRVSRRTAYYVPGANNTVPTASAVWHITWDDLPERPKDGDEIVSSTGQVWCIYKVTSSYVHKHWRCLARMLYLNYEPDEYVNILRAQAQTIGGTTTVIWQTWKSNVPVKFSQNQISVDAQVETLPSEETFRVHFKDNPHLLKSDRIELPDGRQFLIKRIRFSRQTYGWTEVFVILYDKPPKEE